MEPPEVSSLPPTHFDRTKRARAWLITSVAIGVVAAICVGLIVWIGLSRKAVTESAPPEHAQTDTIELDSAQPIQTVAANAQAPSSTFTVAATVEANPQQLQQITPLVSGRVERVYVTLGDSVKAGTLLLRIDSPQIAEQHGKLHEAETRVRLAKVNLSRVQQAANRVSVVKAKATLEEADATLKRTKLLNNEGLAAEKDVVAAQANYDRAKADYQFQKDISLNREVTEAKAELQTAQTEAEHLQDSLKAMDAHLVAESEGNEHEISKIELKSPITGTVIERFVNAGVGFEAGKPLLTIANTGSLWVIANVPESEMKGIRVGSTARVKLSDRTVSGAVSYIDPRLNEDTRTSRVRIEINNPGHKIQAGSFAQVEFDTPRDSSQTVFVPLASIQTVDGKTVVFVMDAPGKFQLRQVQTGPATAGLVPVKTGLRAGEQVAADGSFILKSKLLKEQFGDAD